MTAPRVGRHSIHPATKWIADVVSKDHEWHEVEDLMDQLLATGMPLKPELSTGKPWLNIRQAARYHVQQATNRPSYEKVKYGKKLGRVRRREDVKYGGSMVACSACGRFPLSVAQRARKNVTYRVPWNEGEDPLKRNLKGDYIVATLPMKYLCFSCVEEEIEAGGGRWNRQMNNGEVSHG